MEAIFNSDMKIIATKLARLNGVFKITSTQEQIDCQFKNADKDEFHIFITNLINHSAILAGIKMKNDEHYYALTLCSVGTNKYTMLETRVAIDNNLNALNNELMSLYSSCVGDNNDTTNQINGLQATLNQIQEMTSYRYKELAPNRFSIDIGNGYVIGIVENKFERLFDDDCDYSTNAYLYKVENGKHILIDESVVEKNNVFTISAMIGVFLSKANANV